MSTLFTVTLITAVGSFLLNSNINMLPSTIISDSRGHDKDPCFGTEHRSLYHLLGKEFGGAVFAYVTSIICHSGQGLTTVRSTIPNHIANEVVGDTSKRAIGIT